MLIRMSCLLLLVSTTVDAQCSQWLAIRYPGVTGSISGATWWDPDGPGPLRARLVIGGSFGVAVRTTCRSITAWEPVADEWAGDLSNWGSPEQRVVLAVGITAGNEIVAATRRWPWPYVDEVMLRTSNGWTSLGVTGLVHAFANLPTSELIAAGYFGTIGGAIASNIARWNGTTWSPLGGGTNAAVHCLASLPNGDLVAGGWFSAAGTASVSFVARWDGLGWSPLGSGTNGPVFSLLALANGDLVAGGTFTAAGSVPVANIARWNGTTWAPLGAGLDGSNTANGGPRVQALSQLANGDLVAGGHFTSSGTTGTQHVARWDGVAWNPLQYGVGEEVHALAVMPGGDLLLMGDHQWVGSMQAPGIVRWNGTSWHAMGEGLAEPSWSLGTMANGDIVAGGVGVTGLARWDGAAWSAVGSANGGGNPDAIVGMANGDLVVGGGFHFLAGATIPFLMRWDGTAWFPLGSGVNGRVFAIVALPNGDLVVGGSFTMAGGLQANRIARWDGTTWFPLGGMNNDVTALTLLPDGSLVAGGWFTSAGGVSASRIARWDGSSWSPLGSGCNDGVNALTVTPLGEVVAGGRFTAAGGAVAQRIARWDGSNWSSLGSGMDGSVEDLLALPNGHVVASGWFSTAGGVIAPGVARWDGAAWSTFGTGVQFGTGWRLPMTLLRDGGFVLGGRVLSVDGVLGVHFARLASTCSATTSSTSSGCSVPGPVLAADAPAWAGGVLRTTTTGLQANAVAVRAIGLGTQAMQLTSLVAQATPGCTWRVTTEVLTFHLPIAGSVRTSFAVPADPVWIGLTLHQQMLSAVIGSTGGIQSVDASNAITFTVGGL